MYWPPFGLNHSTESVWIGLNQGCTSRYCNFIPFFAKLFRLWQAAQGSDVNSTFQVQPQILYWIKIWVWLGHSRTLTLLSLYAPGYCLAGKWMFFQVLVLLQTESGFSSWAMEINQVRHNRHMHSVQMQLIHRHLHSEDIARLNVTICRRCAVVECNSQ